MTRAFILKRDQILVLIAKDFKLKYNSTALGFAWSLIVPIFTSLIYYLVFGMFIRWNIPNYLLYLVAGNFMWHFFSNVITMNGRTLRTNAVLLKKTSFDRRLLIWGTFFTESMHFLLTIPVLIGIMFLYGVTPQWTTIVPNLIVTFYSLAMLSMGVGYAYAAANLYFRDLERIIGVIMRTWLFLSPVFIPISRIPEDFLKYYKLNPMVDILCTWRDIFYEPGFHPERFLYIVLTSTVVFILGRWLFRKLEPRFAEMM